jgi:hypothetical protein
MVCFAGLSNSCAITGSVFNPSLSSLSVLRPNTALELTPLRGPKIDAILKAEFAPGAFPIYEGGAAKRQDVSPQVISPIGRELYDRSLSSSD